MHVVCDVCGVVWCVYCIVCESDLLILPISLTHLMHTIGLFPSPMVVTGQLTESMGVQAKLV